MEPDNVERRLAAVVHADVVGYSRLMRVDEVGTHRTLLAYLDAIKGHIESHGGAVVNYAGDAVLAEFQSAVVALSCAVKIQQELEGRNRSLPDEKKLEFRIGINLGDVIAARSDIYGDGVNVAARLEGLAKPGGVCISRAVLDQVRTKLAFGYESLGDQQVKNIAEPVRAYRVIPAPKVAGMVVGEERPGSRPGRMLPAALGALLVVVIAIVGLALWYGLLEQPRFQPQETAEKSEGPAPSAKPSIAVLPLKNLGGAAEQDYFSDGITEDIITDLSRFEGLLVIASSTMFTFKDQKATIQDVADRLGVRYVLEGSVQKSGERLRVNAQLIDGTTGHLLWGERLVRDMGRSL